MVTRSTRQRPRHKGNTRRLRTLPPDDAARRVTAALARAPYLARSEQRQAWHIPTGRAFILCLVGDAITECRPQSPAAAALVQGEPLAWAARQDWWLEPAAVRRAS